MCCGERAKADGTVLSEPSCAGAECSRTDEWKEISRFWDKTPYTAVCPKSGDFLIRKEEDGKVKAFIHVYPEDNEEAINCIIFRDDLNAHIEDAKKYENLKLELYNKYKSNRPKYTEGKNEYIKAIINKAKNEEYR